MRTQWISLLSPVVAVTVVVAGPLPASADLVTSCTGTASQVTVPGDLVVPAGRSCDLTGVTVTGDTTVRAGANLLLRESVLAGGLTVQQGGYAELTGSSVGGITRLNQAFAGYVENSTLSGAAASNGIFYAVGAALGNVRSVDGENYLESVRLSRNLNASRGASMDVHDSVVEGTFTVAGVTSGSVLCGSEIDGDVALTGNGGGDKAIVQVGLGPQEGCAFNVFGGGLALAGNTAPAYVGGNVIRGALACADNSADPVLSGNRVRGGTTAQCADALAQTGTAATVAGTAATVAGSAATDAAAESTASADRRADLLSRIRARSQAATTAAIAAGPAAIR